MTPPPPHAWGKYESGAEWHALSCHCMDVAAVFEALLSLAILHERVEAAADRTLSEDDLARLSALVFLHDMGKLNPGFQVKGWADKSLWTRRTVSHSSAGVGLVALAHCDSRNPLHATVRAISGWGDGVGELLMAIFAHHGRPVKCGQDLPDDWPPLPVYDWRAQAEALRAMLRAAFPAAFRPVGRSLPERPAFVHVIAGLTALADWIGSDRQFFELWPNLGDAR